MKEKLFVLKNWQRMGKIYIERVRKQRKKKMDAETEFIFDRIEQNF